MNETRLMTERFDRAAEETSGEIRDILLSLPDGIKEKAEEIRLRNSAPLSITADGKPLYVRTDFSVTPFPDANCRTVREEEIAESYKKLIRNSVYSHIGEISEGYVMLRYGNRAGICGTAAKSGNMTDISSVNIRIARQVFGSADVLRKNFRGLGVLICGEPGSGKTTLLRDLIYQLSSGKFGTFYKVAAVDTRGELSAASKGVNYNELGENTDVLLGYGKRKGIEMALRTLSPDVIAFDEIGSTEELESVSEGFGAGVSFITTAHIGSKEDVMKREITARLIRSGAVKTVAVISSREDKRVSVYSAEEFLI